MQYAHNLGDSISGKGDACQAYTYQTNSTKWLIDFPQVVTTRTGGCTGTVAAGTEHGYDTLAVGAGVTTGNATLVRVYRASTTVAAMINQTKYTFDSFGRGTSMQNPNGVQAGSGGVTTIGYADPNSGSYVLRVHTTSPLGYSTWVNREPGSGNVVASTDTRQQVSTLDYDDLGRLTAVWTPDNPKPGSGGNPTNAYTYAVSTTTGGKVQSQQETTAGAGDYLSSWAYYDGLGRATQTQSASPNPVGATITQDTRYDDRGQPWRVTGPTLYSGAPGAARTVVDPAAVPSATYTGYDALGRTVTSTLKSNGNVYNDASGVAHVTTTAFYGDHATTNPPVGGVIATYVDANGLTTSVSQNNGSGRAVETDYSYDPLGRIHTTSTDAITASATSTYGYDMAGERTSNYDADSHDHNTTYDNDGNQLTITDANSSTVATVYDAENRATSVRAGSATGTVLASWSYYGSASQFAGQLQNSVSNGGTGAVYTQSNTAYDSLNNPTTQTLNVQSSGTVAGGTLDGTYTSTAARNQLGALTSITSPAVPGFPAETVWYNYDSIGDLFMVDSSAKTYQKSATYNGIGEMTDRHLGSTSDPLPPIEFTRDMVRNAADHSLQSVTTTQWVAGGIVGVVANDSFTWDAGENRTSAADAVVGQTQCFHYDNLNRLTQAFTDATGCAAAQHAVSPAGAPAYDLSYAYSGSTAFKTVTDNIANGAATYNYATAGHPHAISSVTGNANPGGSPGASITGAYTVDNTGQTITTQNSSNTLTYNKLHQLSASHFTAGTSHFDYNAAGDRVLKVDADGTTTLYLFGDELVENAAHTASTVNRYYRAGGTTIAERSGAATPGTAYWVLSDDQASTSLIINAATGTVLSRQRYLPFGALRSSTATGALPTTHSYLGQPLDASGLLYDGARYYNPALGAFTVPDPLGADLSVNPYAYSNGNPTTISDPSGLRPVYPNDCGRGSCLDNGPSHGGSCNGVVGFFSCAQHAVTGIAVDGIVSGVQGEVNGVTDFFTLGHGTNYNSCPDRTFSMVCSASQDVGWVAGGQMGLEIAAVPVAAAVLLGPEEAVAAGAAGVVVAEDDSGPLSEILSSDGAAANGVSLSLKYKPGWDVAQRAAADTKVNALNNAAGSGGLRVTQVVRSGSSAASRYSRAGGHIPSGSDVDHTIDLQLGGLDRFFNMNPLNLSVNRSLGAQIGWQLRGLEPGTCVIGVMIC